METSDRDIALKYIQRFIGTPYRWGGDNPMEGFDCSGLVVEMLRAVGIIGRRADLSAAGLWGMLKASRVTQPTRGCLVFFGSRTHPKQVTHVEILLTSRLSIGASGGGSKTTNLPAAAHADAYVKLRPVERGRPIVGYADPFITPQ